MVGPTSCHLFRYAQCKTDFLNLLLGSQLLLSLTLSLTFKEAGLFAYRLHSYTQEYSNLGGL